MSSFGIFTSNNMDGFVTSQYPCMVAMARGSTSYRTYPSWGYGSRIDNRPTQLIIPVTLDKYFSRSMMRNFALPNGSQYNARISSDLRLFVGTNSGRTASVVGFTRYDDNWAPNNINGRISCVWSENSTRITLWVAVATGSESSWYVNPGVAVTETVYALIFGSLPASGQEINDYGILIKNDSGVNTFNSYYMPYNPTTYITPQGVPATWASTPGMSQTGVSGKFLLPAQFAVAGISPSNQDNRRFCEMRTILSSDGQRHGVRIGGWYTNTPNNMSRINYMTSGAYNRLPLLSVNDYF